MTTPPRAARTARGTGRTTPKGTTAGRESPAAPASQAMGRAHRSSSGSEGPIGPPAQDEVAQAVRGALGRAKLFAALGLVLALVGAVSLSASGAVGAVVGIGVGLGWSIAVGTATLGYVAVSVARELGPPAK